LPGERKRRPALVVSANVRNELATTVVVIPATTSPRVGPWHVRLKQGEGGLPHASVLRCENIVAIPKRLLEDRPLGGALSRSRLSEVRAALLSALDFD
jgi:mRNA interferase MazF